MRFEKCCNAWGIGKVLYYRLNTSRIYIYIFFSIQTTVQTCSDKTNYRYIFSKSSGIYPLQIVSFDWSLYFVLLTYWAHFSLLLTKNIVPPAKKNKVICKLLLHNTVESYFVVWYKIIFHSTAKWGYKQKIFAINSANIFFQEIVSLALTL